jgi:hypothetical protein
MAERGGVDPAVLRAIVSRDFAAMPDEVAARAALLGLVAVGSGALCTRTSHRNRG